MSINAYQRSQTMSESPRAMERRLVAQVTADLVSAQEQNLKGAALMDALQRNREMWQAFSSLCATEGNELPVTLRAGIMSLALWVDRHSSMVATGHEELEALIDVNRMIGEGLSGEARAAA